MLYVYVASHCRACDTAYILVNQLKTLRPHVRITLVDMDISDMAIPAHVIGTPMYLWDDKILFMGNPDMPELLECVDTCWQAVTH